MKKIIIIWLLVFVAVKYTKAQECWDPVKPNTVTTDWRAASTSNTWDWTQEKFDYYIAGRSNPVNDYSPFWSPSGAAGPNKVLSGFQVYKKREDKDFHPEDGWELLVKNLGEPGSPVDNPFFALYNKYTGKLRAFLLVADKPNSVVSGALLKANFQGGERSTALWQHMKPIGQAVQHFDKDLYADLPNQYRNVDDFWLFSEFVVAYDPCTCLDLGELSFHSFLNFDYSVVIVSDIDATIGGTFAERVTQNKEPQSGNPSFALNSIDQVKKAVDAGQKGYKTWSTYKSFYNDQLNQFTDSMYRDQLWKGLEASKELSPDFYDDLLQDLIGQNTCNYDDFMDGAYDIDPTAFLTPRKNSFLNSNYSSIKAFASLFPYVGTALGVIDLFVDNGGKTTSAPSGPTVYDVNLKLDGRMEQQGDLDGALFFTPGYTTNSEELNWIPTYNNILGVFNILELPDFEYFEIQPNVTNLTESVAHLGNTCKRNYSDFHNLDGANEVVFKQFKPKDKLKYVLNPASNLIVESVEAAIVLEYLGQDNLFIEKPSEYNSVKAIPYNSLIFNSSRNDTLLSDAWEVPGLIIKDFTPNPLGSFINENGLKNLDGSFAANLSQIPKSGMKRASVERLKAIIEHTDLTLEMANSNYPNEDSSELHLRTDYLPNTCFDKLSFTVLGNNNFGNIYAKVVVRLKHKNRPELDPVTLVFAYDLTQKLQTATKRSETGSYSPRIWGRNWSDQVRCCYKCGTAMTFTSAEIENFRYVEGITLDNTPYNWDFFKPHNQTYNGEPSLTAIGTVTIPDGTFIPPNTVIRAGGVVNIGRDVVIGDGSQISSEVQINLPDGGADIERNVILEIASKGSIKYNCSDYDYESLEMTGESITAFCGKQDYKQRALHKRNLTEEEDKDNISKNISPPLDYKIYPNPNAGIFEVQFTTTSEGVYLEVLDALGRVVQELFKPADMNVISVDISGNQSGIYFVKVAGSNSSHLVKKLVKY